MAKRDWEQLTNPTGSRPEGSRPPRPEPPPTIPATPSGPVPTTITGTRDFVGPKIAPIVRGGKG
jgi:hypothetical protein